MKVLPLVVLVTGFGTTQWVSAQDVARGETVRTRARPELDALGIRVGGFQVYPSLTVRERLDDNIFAVDRNEEEDLITIVRPALRVRSDWTRHALNFQADAAVAYHLDVDDEDYEDFRVGVDGYLDITRERRLEGRAEYAALHEPRRSPDDVRGAEPTQFDTALVEAAYAHRLGRFVLRFRGLAERFDYDDVPAASGTIIDNDDRDQQNYEAALQVNYDIFPPRYSAFVRGTVNARPHDEEIDRNGVDRDSDGYEIVFGTDFDLSGVTFGEVFAGYRSQTFDDPLLGTVDGPSFGASVTWTPTGLTTVTATVTRQIHNTIVRQGAGVAAARFSSAFKLVLDHELFRNLLLQARFVYTLDEFDGIDRDDDIIDVGFGAEYLMNRYVYLFVDYDYDQRDSTVPGLANAFGRNAFMLGVRLQL